MKKLASITLVAMLCLPTFGASTNFHLMALGTNDHQLLGSSSIGPFYMDNPSNTIKLALGTVSAAPTSGVDIVNMAYADSIVGITNANAVTANFVPTNYTAAAGDVSSHLQGIDEEIADIQASTNSYVITNDTRDLDFTGGNVLVPCCPTDTNSAIPLGYLNNQLSRTKTFYFQGGVTSTVPDFYVLATTQSVTSTSTEFVYTDPTNGQWLARFMSDPGVPGITEVQQGDYDSRLFAKKVGSKPISIGIYGVLRDSAGTVKYTYPLYGSNLLTTTSEAGKYVIGVQANIPSLVTDRWSMDTRVTGTEGPPYPDVYIYTEGLTHGYLSGIQGSGAETDPVWVAVTNNYTLTNSPNLNAWTNDTTGWFDGVYLGSNGVYATDPTGLTNGWLTW